MSSSGHQGKERNQAQAADPAKAQARKMLSMLCELMLPVIQSATERTMDPKKVDFGAEADEVVTELENFISGIISRSEPRKDDITIEAALGKELVSRQKGEVWMDRSPWNPPNIPTYHPKKDLGEGLLELRKHVTQAMPIRLLCFEPHGSILKISLLERADVYTRLELKLRADFSLHKHIEMNRWISERVGYAILSHTWNQVPGELTYGDWKNSSLDTTQPKCQKLVDFCKAAWANHDLTLGWIDTVCINKESSAELDESIRSMYAWYKKAKVCITYLAATNTLSDMRNDPWFTRGWTLQELLAPRLIKFYNRHWTQLAEDSNDKHNISIRLEIESATSITSHELHDISRATISRRMQLAAKRKVTRGEDIAYCLMGIFDVSISTAYGEGADRAFFRLVEEIFRSTKDISDIFNWAGYRERFGREPTSALFPSHPSHYLNRSTNRQLRPWHPIEPLTLTHLGLRTPILLMPAIPLRGAAVPPYPPPVGDYHAAISVGVYQAEFQFYDSLYILPKHYLLLDKRISGPEAVHTDYDMAGISKITLAFGTLNVEEQLTSICIPKTCLAVLLSHQENTSSSEYKRAYTQHPIVFNLTKIRGNLDGEDEKCYLIKRSSLEKHGMRLVTLYL